MKTMYEGHGPNVELTLPTKPNVRRQKSNATSSTPLAGPSATGDSSWPPKRKKTRKNTLADDTQPKASSSKAILSDEDYSDDLAWPPKRKKARVNGAVDGKGGPLSSNANMFPDDQMDLNDLFDPSEVIDLDINEGDIVDDPFAQSKNERTKYEVLASDSSSDVDADFTFTLDGRTLMRDMPKDPPPKARPKPVEVIDLADSDT